MWLCILGSGIARYRKFNAWNGSVYEDDIPKYLMLAWVRDLGRPLLPLDLHVNERYST